MRQLSTFCVLTAAALSLTGCGQVPGWPSTAKSSARGGMAVVDLDKVALETGRDRQLAQSVKMEENSLNQQLAKTVENAQEQLDAKKKSYGEELSDADKKELSDWTISARNQLTQIQNQARAKYEQFKQSQIAQFRADLKPLAQEIAAKRGLGVVVPKNEGLLLAIDPGVDITDEVIKALKEKHPTPVMPVQPTPPAQTADTDELPTKPSAATRNSSSAKPAARTRAARSDDDQHSTR